MKTLFLAILCSISFSSLFAQNDSSKLEVSGYFEMFYAYDFNNNGAGIKQDFLYSYNRTHQFALNLALIQLKYENDFARLNVGLQTGTYAIDNYAHERELYRYLHEANFDLWLNKKKNLFLTTGLFSSHLGFESAIGANNYSLSQSLVSENSPYYLFGSKLTYQASDRWTFSATACNGWQQIEVDTFRNDKLPDFGTQVSYQSKNGLTVNWSTFIGLTSYTAPMVYRIYNNFHLILNKNKYDFVVGLDIGFDPWKNLIDGQNWNIFTMIYRRHLNNKFDVAARFEIMNDNYVMLPYRPYYKGQNQVEGFSLNLEYKITLTSLLRIEQRLFTSPGNYFVNEKGYTSRFNMTTVSYSLRF